MLIEYPDVEERREALTRLVGIEDQIWMRVEGFDPVMGIADEDMERANADKTAAVHFLRFQLSDDQAEALKAGAEWRIGVQHAVYTYEYTVEGETRDNLLQDLD